MTRSGRALTWALGAVVAALWLALARLAIAFFRSELDWEYVAEQSRRGAPWYYRLAGVWGGMPGSLLLFTAIVATVGLVAVTSRTVRASDEPLPVVFVLGTVLVLGTVNLALASPFGTLDVPATEGFGLTPILEHPAMAVHPPLLYLGLACALPPCLLALRSRDLAPARRWLLAVIGLLAVAMTLGAIWSYMEQGWGGYWAWDPVENTSLLVWLAAIAAVHGLPARMRGARWLASSPWLLVLVGAALVRSGATPSIHGFSEQRSVGWALLALLAVTAIVVGLTRAETTASAAARFADHRTISVVLVAAVALIVVGGTLAPLVADIVSDRPAAVRGTFYAATVGLLALVSVPFVAMRMRSWRGASTVAHAGVLVLLVGVAASTFDRTSAGPLAQDATIDAAGVTITNEGIEVVEGSRQGTTAVIARLRVDGRAMSPSLVAYPDRGGRLAEVATTPGAWRDVQVVLDNANDDGTAVITVRTRPLVWLLWLGPLLVAGATLAPLARRRQPDVAGAGSGHD